ncbi:Transposon TX1 uncharacterized 149 kDa protein [Trametes pubescens]|uniref:Transposon TX1 uncharacterized 149 kDa protein n=1 Tax=Trametes pubescens TaxID=154538 RepID=A0A1M2VVU1_TRAPU|nr:Transposon TX1 uncharacterized 149 kDa protein [Trametes pubescens]OJT11725.1 Transposon TX1 uncharacterized 149 kDa protein [Trametes pubescens]OJT15587.1 Transposon TX1 uncharacterized 149 kDa protein [Trametes pubescens]
MHPSNEGPVLYGSGNVPIGGPRVPANPSGRRTRARLRFASLNINGFGRLLPTGGTDKWLGINQLMKEKRLAVLAVQEAHLTEDRLRALNVLFASQLLVLASPDPENASGAGGVAFVFSRKHLKGADPVLDVVRPGRAASVVFPWAVNRSLTILNVYAPNCSAKNAEFWTELKEHYVGMGAAKPDILLGDFNVVDDPADRIPSRADAAAAVEALAHLRALLGVVDSWRRAHPAERAFSYMQMSTGSQSRLDRIYVSRPLLPAIADWDLGPPGIITDHHLVSCSIANYHAPNIGRGRWAFPPVLLEDPIFVKTMRDLGLNLKNQVALLGDRTEEINVQKLFYEFKTSFAEAARERMKARVATSERKGTRLREQIRSALHPDVLRVPTTEDVESAGLLREKLTKLESGRFGRRKAMNAAKDWVEGERIGRYWMRANAPHALDGTFYEMAKLGPGPVTYANDTKQMCKIARTFYDDLQHVDPLDSVATHDEYIDTVLAGWSERLPNDYKAPLAAPISLEEVREAIDDAAVGKSPGLDGLPAEVYKRYAVWATSAAKTGKPHLDIAEVLRKLFNDIEVHGVAPNVMFAEGWICPIYKLKGDTRQITNYRPITLLNADYKILTRVLATRLVSPASLIVHPDQAGFLPGRRIHDNIRLTKIMLDYAEAEEINGVIVALDQEKAYDRIDHHYLWRLLEHLNFPQRFIRTIRALYDSARSAAMINGTLSESFSITRGVRQGDPVSCLLFNIAIEPLAVAL